MLRFAILPMGIFTVGWMSNAAAADSLPLRVLGLAGVVAGVALVLAWAFSGRLARRHAEPGAPEATEATAPEPPRDERRAHSRFGLAVAAECVGIAIMILLLGRANRPELIMPVVALVVALHFILVYRAYPSPLHIGTTVVGCVVALGGIALILGGTDAQLVQALVGLGMGAITLTYGLLFARAVGALPGGRGGV